MIAPEMTQFSYFISSCFRSKQSDVLHRQRSLQSTPHYIEKITNSATKKMFHALLRIICMLPPWKEHFLSYAEAIMILLIVGANILVVVRKRKTNSFCTLVLSFTRDKVKPND